MFAKVRGTQIYFDVDGSALVLHEAIMRERPTAFLVGGGPGVDHIGYKARYAALKERMQLVYFDHRGHGRSAPCAREEHSLDNHVEDMEALRLHLGLGPIVSIGASYGGMVAIAHAARYPSSVSHLVLIATASHAGFTVRSRELLAQRGSKEQIALYEELLGGRIDTVERMQSYFMKMGPLSARRHNRNSGVGLGPTILTPAASLAARGPEGYLRIFDLRPELGSITASTLIIAGRHDWLCPPEFSEEIHAGIPGSELRIFEESSHAVAGDEPQALLDVVQGFIVYNRRWDGSHPAIPSVVRHE